MVDDTRPDDTTNPNESLGPIFLTTTTVLFWLSVLVYSLRLRARTHPRFAIGLDDVFISIALAIGCAGWCLSIVSVHYGLGHHTNALVQEYGPTSAAYALELLFIQLILYFWCCNFVKLSWAFMLLRIKRDAFWQIFLWVLIAVVFSTTIASTISELLQCRVVATIWNPSLPDASCWSQSDKEIILYLFSVVFIGTDVVFSLLPITFIWKLQRPPSERLAILFLMCSALVATAAGIVKTVLIKDWISPQDPVWNATRSATWAYVEQYLGIITVCAPCLRALFERNLRRFGLMKRAVEGSWGSEDGSHSRLEAVPTQLHSTCSSGKKLKVESRTVPFEDTESQATSERCFIQRRISVELSFSREDPTQQDNSEGIYRADSRQHVWGRWHP